MKTVLTILLVVLFTINVNAQPLYTSIMDLVAAETANYKMMIGALLLLYILYMMLNYRRRRELDKFMGKENDRNKEA